MTFVQEPGDESEWSVQSPDEPREESRGEAREEAREEARDESREENALDLPALPLNGSNGVTPVTATATSGFSPVTSNSWAGSWDSCQGSNLSLTSREAFLLRLFISKIAPWVKSRADGLQAML